MSFLWFLLAVIFLALWLHDRNVLQQKDGDYARGWRDGRDYVKKKIEELDNLTHENIREIFDETKQSVPEQSLSTRSGVLDDIIDPSLQYRSDTVETTGWEALQQSAPAFTVPIELDPATIQAEKERRTLKNLNTLLYLGSFLIVAAAAAFVSLTMPADVKLASLLLVTVAFYVAGLAIHGRSKRLRPAALAFVGTGLAILPFVGFALTSLGGISGPVAWLITSIVGLFAYGLAAVLIQSQLVSYLTMGFVLSFSLAAVSTLGLGILWYFIVMIVVSILYNSIHILMPKAIPAIFAKPVKETGMVITPITLAASLTAMQSMDIFMYEVLFGLATVHYLVVWLETRSSTYEIAARVLGHITIILFAIDKAQRIGGKDGLLVFNLLWCFVAIVQILYSLVRVRKANSYSVTTESTYIAVMFSLMIADLPVFLAVNHSNEWLAGALAIIGILAISVWARLRRAAWLYVTLGVSIVLPFVVGRGIVSPPLGGDVLAIVFAMMGAMALVGLDRAKSTLRSATACELLTVGVTLYAIIVAGCGVVTWHSSTIGWTLLVTAGLFVGLSFVISEVVAEAFGAIFFIFSITAWIEWLNINPDWKTLGAVVVSTALVGFGSIVHHMYRQFDRRDVLAAMAAIEFAGVTLATNAGNVVVTHTVLILLLVAAIMAIALRIVLLTRSSNTISAIAMGAYITYPLLAIIIAMGLGNGWEALVCLVYAGILWVSSYIEKQPGILGLGNLLLAIGLVLLWHVLNLGTEWAVLGVTWIAAAVYYVQYWYNYERKDMTRMTVSFVSAFIALVVAAIPYIMFADMWSVGAASSLVAAAAILAVHGYLLRTNIYIEIAVYLATFGLQRIVSILLPELNLVFYAQWWAAKIFLMGMWQKRYHERAIIALALVTGMTGYYALFVGESYSLLFLIEHILVVVVGAMLRKQWAMWWGIVAVILAVLYFLRNFTALALLFLGFMMILFVVWRLLKINRKQG